MDEAKHYLKKTLRAAGVLVLCAVAVAANLGLVWAIVPFLVGLTLAVLLLLGWWAATEMVVRGGKPSGSAFEKSRQKRRAGGLILGFALVKYPMVAALIWWLTRVWTSHELIAFVLGFLLLHAVIALRAVGKLLNEKSAN